MKLWDKNISTEKRILAFTTGMDPFYDLQLAPYDAMGSMAHAIMLAEVGLIERKDAASLLAALKEIFRKSTEGKLEIEPEIEDIHSQVELMLTRELGDLGKKIHTGRSRNDQVMLDIKLFLRDQIRVLAGEVQETAAILCDQADEHRDAWMPGFTHMQVAMPSSFGLWFGAYAEALADDLIFLDGIHELVNQNPLGSAAGFGSSFPVDRELTTQLLGFRQMHVSSVNAQMNRGKTEWYMAAGIAAIASTLARLAMDAVLFMSQNFNFISLPEELTTGSSIMPHKKNPDVLELIRSKCNHLTQLPSRVSAVTGNLISGYHRDYQLLKEIIHPALEDLGNCLMMMQYVVHRIEVRAGILEDELYSHIFSVEEVNRKVQEGIPFREAYRQVADEIEKGLYRPEKDHQYTHLGSPGNPGIKEIRSKLNMAYGRFNFADTREIVTALGNYYGKS